MLARLCRFVGVGPRTVMIGPPEVAQRCAEQGSYSCSCERGRNAASLIRIGACSDARSHAEADERACDGMAGASGRPHA